LEQGEQLVAVTLYLPLYHPLVEEQVVVVLWLHRMEVQGVVEILGDPPQDPVMLEAIPRLKDMEAELGTKLALITVVVAVVVPVE
jgi:hypothetical protein